MQIDVADTETPHALEVVDIENEQFAAKAIIGIDEIFKLLKGKIISAWN